MGDLNAKAFDALGAYPIIQAAVAALILLGGVYLIFRASRDKSVPREPVPQWLMMGPLHDMMGAVHDVAEQGRQQTDLLRRIEELSGKQLREIEKAKSVLEAIRNESKMR